MNKPFLLSATVTAIFLGLGFTLLHYNLVGYGLSFFVFLPFILGYLLGNSNTKKWSIAGFILSLSVFCVLLLTGGLEGIVCILMAIPIISFFIIVGYVVKAIANLILDLILGGGKPKDDNGDILDDNMLKSSIVPFCLFLAIGFVENYLTQDAKEIVEVKSEIILPFSALQVYETIKSVDTLDAEKPFLMKLDLPVPQKCILEEEKVGGIRTCYFEGGKIVERVTALEKGKLLKMDVIDYQLTGRKWLGFKEAIYIFEEMGTQQCKMTRITTYTSQLYPRVYWEPLERIGIEQEHEYVFRNLKKDLNNKY